MKFPDPLVKATLIKRYKRFLADVRFEDGTETTAHVANPGGMIGLKEPGMTVWLSPARNPARKLRWSWEIAEADGDLVGVSTAHPNAIAEEAILAGHIPELAGFETLRREVKYGKNSRIDILLEDSEKGTAYVEIKNVHLMREPGLAEFPDAVTARGAKHLEELGDMVEAGHAAWMLYVIQRMDCSRFAVASDIDPGYAEALRRAMTRGVGILCYMCDITTQEIRLGKPVELALQPE
jgi:sugar fermentation stimulation protein A